ncbi:vesicle-associated membrane protein/synaptobrevin-binding protein isoform X3 [Drosophila kikkawai]|uniref:Vesicle-associated membrane protein/synaptobrevin-binding protein isoform X3 n=1 Tax=Drosophila kikkawai TaxID=30033 RepID=A0ABM4GAB1_DROKI
MELLSVSPQQLTFYAPYHGPQRRILTLLNPTHMVVLFKIKSNAFRHYRLRPNAGKVEPYATIEVRICLQCFDFHEDQKYNHYLSIQSFLKPENCFNGETTLAFFRSLPREQIYTKCLPINLENKPLFLSKCGPESPCLEKMVMERNRPLRPFCPKCAVPSGPKKYQENGIKIVVIITVFLLAGSPQFPCHEKPHGTPWTFQE